MTKCFLIEPTGTVVLEATATWPTCEKNPFGDNHFGSFVVFQGPKHYAPTENLVGKSFHFICRHCGADGGLRPADSSASGCYWRRTDTGDIERNISGFGVGAMWFADWFQSGKPDDQGRTLYGYDWDNQFTPPLVVATQGGDWNIDSRCSNCTMPQDRTHRCWVRHGEAPEITVDKDGLTCGAGYGSIDFGAKYHGFLRNGELTDSL